MGKKEGNGTIIFPQGYSFNGNWKEGKLIDAEFLSQNILNTPLFIFIFFYLNF
jgi:hypothetical protein